LESQKPDVWHRVVLGFLGVQPMSDSFRSGPQKQLSGFILLYSLWLWQRGAGATASVRPSSKSLWRLASTLLKMLAVMNFKFWHAVPCLMVLVWQDLIFILIWSTFFIRF